MLASGQLDVWHLPPDRPRAIFVEPFEQRCPPEHNFGVLHRSSLPASPPLTAASGPGQRPSWPCPLSESFARTDVLGITFQPRSGGNSDETNITSRRKIATLSSREHRERDGAESGGGWGLRYARGSGGKARRSGGKVRYRLGGRASLPWWWGAACSWRSALRRPRRDRGWKATP